MFILYIKYMEDRELLIKQIGEMVDQLGGKTFYVGGYVRDKLLGIENKDIDIEVYGIDEKQLEKILSNFSDVLYFGKSFGIYSLRKYDIDIALPRSEKSIGNRHRDFEVTIDPNLSYEAGARRRDFTINALMQDVLTLDIYDYFNGLDDLNNKIIRCVDPITFVEDPLRVLRGAQFASRFEFVIEDKTIELCKSIDISNLSSERVEEELKKALLKANKPSIFFDYLLKMNHLNYWFKEVEELIGIKQSPIYHPEGDVYVHTMEVIDRCKLYVEEVSNPYYFLLLGLCHDFGKVLTTTVDEEGRIHSYNHENELSLMNTFIKRLTDKRNIKKYLNNMIPLHMRPLACAKNKAGEKATNKLFDSAIAPKDLIYFSLSDHGNTSQEDIDFLFERYQIYCELMAREHVKGQDLIDSGLGPDEDFKELLSYAHKLHLAGVDKETALKQTIAYKKQLDRKK